MRPKGDKKLYPKTEVKNLNSFKSVEKALSYEIKRQSAIWEKNQTSPMEQETRGWDENTGKTIVQRDKEESADYRYFPEPDIPELEFDEEWINTLKFSIPELPSATRNRFCRQYGFKEEDAKIFSSDKSLAQFAEKVFSESRAWLVSQDTEMSQEEAFQKAKPAMSKLVSSWILTNLLGLVRSEGASISDIKITPENLAELIIMIYCKKVNKSIAQKILEKMYKTGGDPSEIMEKTGLHYEEDSGQLDEAVLKVINLNPDQVKEFKSGKTQVINYLVGKVVKETKGKSDPPVVRELLEKKLL